MPISVFACKVYMGRDEKLIIYFHSEFLSGGGGGGGAKATVWKHASKTSQEPFGNKYLAKYGFHFT